MTEPKQKRVRTSSSRFIDMEAADDSDEQHNDSDGDCEKDDDSDHANTSDEEFVDDREVSAQSSSSSSSSSSSESDDDVTEPAVLTIDNPMPERAQKGIPTTAFKVILRMNKTEQIIERGTAVMGNEQTEISWIYDNETKILTISDNHPSSGKQRLFDLRDDLTIEIQHNSKPFFRKKIIGDPFEMVQWEFTPCVDEEVSKPCSLFQNGEDESRGYLEFKSNKCTVSFDTFLYCATGAIRVKLIECKFHE